MSQISEDIISELEAEYGVELDSNFDTSFECERASFTLGGFACQPCTDEMIASIKAQLMKQAEEKQQYLSELQKERGE